MNITLDIYILMEVSIVLVSLCAIVLEIRKMVKLGFHPITFLVVVACSFWASFYSYQIVRLFFDLSLPDHRTFVRSGILFSVVIFLIKAIRVNRRIK